MAKRRATSKQASPDAKKGRKLLSVAQRAAQKLRENFVSLTEEEREGYAPEATGLTLRDKLEKDIKDSDEKGTISWGKWYFESLRTVYRSEKSIHKLLSPDPADRDPIAEKLMEAMSHHGPLSSKFYESHACTSMSVRVHACHMHVCMYMSA